MFPLRRHFRVLASHRCYSIQFRNEGGHHTLAVPLSQASSTTYGTVASSNVKGLMWLASSVAAKSWSALLTCVRRVVGRFLDRSILRTARTAQEVQGGC